jgi:hypothetical protein
MKAQKALEYVYCKVEYTKLLFNAHSFYAFFP